MAREEEGQGRDIAKERRGASEYVKKVGARSPPVRTARDASGNVGSGLVHAVTTVCSAHSSQQFFRRIMHGIEMIRGSV